MAVVLNAIFNKTPSLTVDPFTVANSVVQFSVNGTPAFVIGVDNSSAGAWKVSNGSALGVNDAIIITPSGAEIKPRQPAFLSCLSSSVTNVTGDGTGYDVVFNSNIYDQSSSLNTSTGVFTAPVAGRYLFTCTLVLTGLSSVNTTDLVKLVGTNRTIFFALHNPVSNITATDFGVNGSTYLDMNLGDTAYILIKVSGGTKVVGLAGGSTGQLCFFGGSLIC